MLIDFDDSLTKCSKGIPIFGPLSNKIPPVLEAVATQKNSSSIGLTKDGRTVSWMRSLQYIITAPFSLAGGIAGGSIGAVVDVGRCLFTRKADNENYSYATGTCVGAFAGTLLGTIPGLVAGSVISSVTVPPVSGIVNLVCDPYKKDQYSQ